MRNILFLIVFMMAACQPVTVQHHEEGPVPVTLRVDDAAYWLEEWHRLSALPKDQFEPILAAREQEYKRDPNDVRTRLRLALLLAAGPEKVRDERRAQSLLKGLDETQASESARALAALLGQILRERVEVSGKITQMKRETVQSEERVKELERQLQELTNIEQSIQQRETPVEQKE